MSTLRGLKVNKTTGLDKTPTQILKLSASIVAPSWTYIFNLSLATGIYTDDWKRARVTLIFKSGDRMQCGNYRPISILPAVSKVFEKEVLRQVYGYLTENCMLSKFQSGLRPKHCTVTALIQMCDEWLENMDNGKLNGVVFLQSWTKWLRKLWFWTYCNHNYDKHAVVCAWKCPPTPPVNVARQNKDCETSAYQHWSLGGRGWLVECDIEGVVGKVTPVFKYSQPFLSKIV